MEMKTIDARTAYAEVLRPPRRSAAMPMRPSGPCPQVMWCGRGISTSPAWTASRAGGGRDAATGPGVNPRVEARGGGGLRRAPSLA